VRRASGVLAGCLEAAEIELKQRGGKFAEPEEPAAGGGRMPFLADAEGNLLRLVERPAAPALS